MSEPLLVPSQRATTSSRTPGRVNTGTVWHVSAGLIGCPDCGRLMLDLVPLGQHAVRWVGNRLLNCAGLEVGR